MGLAVASSSMAATTVNHVSTKPHDSNLVGYIPITGSDVRPFGISATDDNSIVVTALGTIPPQEESGSILRLRPSEESFSKVNIVTSGDQHFYALTSGVYSKERGSLFVCSIPDLTTFEDMPPSVVEFKIKPDGSYAWHSVMNFSDDQGQLCKGITIVKDRLFAVNPMYSSANDPAIYSADLSSGNNMPANMEVVQRYSDLNFPEVEPEEKERQLGITDIVSAKDQEDSGYSLYILDTVGSTISGLKFELEQESAKLNRVGEIDKRDIEVDPPLFPSAFASFNDNTFFVSFSPDPLTAESNQTKIYKFKFSDAGVSKELISEAYSPIAAMTIANSHLRDDGNHHHRSLFAALVRRNDEGVYNVGEYKLGEKNS